jgi:hypothetical protein
MAYREFTDAAGRQWQAWDVHPSAASLAGFHKGPAFSRELQSGWIAFRCEVERRRLAPPVPRWEELGEEQLRRLLMEAELVPVRRESPG